MNYKAADQSPKLELQLKLSPPRYHQQDVSSDCSTPRSSCVSREVSPDGTSSRSMMVVAGCPRCLMYVMLYEEDPKCPKCKSSTVLLQFLRHNKWSINLIINTTFIYMLEERKSKYWVLEFVFNRSLLPSSLSLIELILSMLFYLLSKQFFLLFYQFLLSIFIRFFFFCNTYFHTFRHKFFVTMMTYSCVANFI